MNFETFKNYYADTMMHYQCIENDIKLIYAFMLAGAINDNFENIENKTLGVMIALLERLDYLDDKPYISRGDYKFLKKICNKRNYWAHQAFVDFIYIKDWHCSKEYEDICRSLENDREEVVRAASILEKMRLEYCKRHKR